MALLVFLLHIVLDLFIGKGILEFIAKKPFSIGWSFIAILIGFFVETTISFLVLWAGGSLVVALFVLFVLMLVVNSKFILQFIKSPKYFFPDLKKIKNSILKIEWYSWILLVLIFQKLLFLFWQLERMPTYHSDTIKHWSTQARALYGQVNWSMDSTTYEFLAIKLRTVYGYPLQIPIWRAISATLNGEWNEFLSRSDSLLFFILIGGILGCTVWNLTKKRWLSFGAIYIFASLPLHVWHGAGGYADIAVEAYLLAAVACFISKEWLLCGLFMAGTIWSKNEGLAIYLPSMLVAGFIFHIFYKDRLLIDKAKKMGQFLIGFSLIVPWLIFQALYTVSIFSRLVKPLKGLLGYEQQYDPNNYEVLLTQVGTQFQSSPPSYQLFWDYVFTGSSFGIFWLCLFIGLILLSKRMLTDSIGRSLLVFFIVTCILLYYTFTYTSAYEFLLTQTTIHRVLLQFSAPSLLILFYGIHLHLEIEKKPLKVTTKLKV